ncbi:hypothetical protein EWI07_12030 [Sporolactobacillus sp. THM7-4]|nr:hypothetical protein EWI07_12030 [Sporolactobacillus sp. THM7-4]
MKRTIQATISSHASVLGRVADILAKRHLAIHRLTVERLIENDKLSCLILETDVENLHQSEQLVRQFDKLIDVISVADVTEKKLRTNVGFY